MEVIMQLSKIVASEIEKVLKDKGIEGVEIFVERPKDEQFGDYSTNVAMKLAKQMRKAPIAIAGELKELLEKSKIFEKVEIAGAGFINFYFSKEFIFTVLKNVISEKDNFGKSTIGNSEKVMIEYVSANPTGYLHVGHGRGAVVGDVLAKVLTFAGYDVFKEYYVNDAGSQIDKLAMSVYLRYREILGEKVDFIEDGYNGEYIYFIAEEIKAKYGDSLNKKYETVKAEFVEFSLKWSLKEIEADLEKFGIEFDNWFSEKSLYDNKKVFSTIEKLQKNGFVYEHEGAKWFKTTDFGDDKDRVAVRGDGTTTYYASDIAYHEDKISRGYKKLIDVWGADHHGYIKRVEASIEALGYGKNVLDVILVQIVNLFKDGQPFVMSKRAGTFITLRDLIDEVGKDAARIFFIMRSSDSQFDFDLEEAKKQSSDNPAYYIQYAHARICSIIEKVGIKLDKIEGFELNLLKESEELRIVKKLAEFEELIELIAKNNEVHRLIKYGQELASLLHSFYNKHRVINEDKEMETARVQLLFGVKIVLKNILTLVGVTAPERM
jgi:arginyl-tRNA synthetase